MKKFLFFLFFLVGCVSINQDNFGLSMDLNFSNPIFKKGDVFGVDSLIIFEGDIEDGKIFIKKYKSVEEEFVKEFITAMNFSIFSIYSNKTATYPGFITKKTQCSEEFLPSFQDISENISRIDLVSNERYTFGVCERSEVMFNTSVIFLRCDKDFFVINFFSKNKVFDIDRNFRCN